MSGRAGRRGKDSHGLAIMMVDSELDAPTCKAMVQACSFLLFYH